MVLASWKVREEGALERDSGVNGMSCCCSLLLWVQVSWEPLAFRSWVPMAEEVGEEEEEENGTAVLPRRRAMLGPLS